MSDYQIVDVTTMQDNDGFKRELVIESKRSAPRCLDCEQIAIYPMYCKDHFYKLGWTDEQGVAYLTGKYREA